MGFRHVRRLPATGAGLGGPNVLAAAGLPRMRFHDLRHGYATLMLSHGVDLAVIRDALGHSSITLTANVYAHVAPKLRRDAAERLDALIVG